MEPQEEPAVIPVVEEELVARTREVKTGTVRVTKKIEQVRKVVTAPAVRDVLQVRRVPVGRVVESIPSMREEGDVLVIPVVEEELIIQKRLVLKEEIHIKRRRRRTSISKEVTLDREHAVVEKLDAEGNVVARSGPRRDNSSAPASGRPHRSLVR
jgi:uncharacterized protein (TIGR02271 family)